MSSPLESSMLDALRCAMHILALIQHHYLPRTSDRTQIQCFNDGMSFNGPVSSENITELLPHKAREEKERNENKRRCLTSFLNKTHTESWYVD